MKKIIRNFIPLSLAAILLLATANVGIAALLGDVDGISGVSAADARLVLRASVGLEIFSPEQTRLSDVDGIPGISAADARLILRESVGLEALGEKEEAHVHNYKVKEITREPTCTGSGRQTLLCSCGDETKEYIDALGHNYQLTKAEAPTCKKQGKNIFACSRCSYSRTEYVDRVDHDYQITEDKPAKCETGGHIKYQCKNCTSIKADQFPAIGHNYNADSGLCENCGLSDPSHYEEIPLGGKWIVADNWEISIESVRNHSLDSSSINASQGYTNEQCVLITYKVKNIGYKPHLANATGLIITPLDFNVYDGTGMQADNYVCKHTDYAQVDIKGLSDIGTVPVVLHNDSNEITFVISEYDSNGVMRRAFFTAPITG